MNTPESGEVRTALQAIDDIVVSVASPQDTDSDEPKLSIEVERLQNIARRNAEFRRVFGSPKKRTPRKTRKRVPKGTIEPSRRISRISLKVQVIAHLSRPSLFML